MRKGRRKKKKDALVSHFRRGAEQFAAATEPGSRGKEREKPFWSFFLSFYCVIVGGKRRGEKEKREAEGTPHSTPGAVHRVAFSRQSPRLRQKKKISIPALSFPIWRTEIVGGVSPPTVHNTRCSLPPPCFHISCGLDAVRMEGEKKEKKKRDRILRHGITDLSGR